MRLRRIAIVFLLTLLFLCGFTELFLRFADPFGALRYFADIRAVYSAYREDVRGFVFTPGNYTFNGWQAVILPDTTRLVPETTTDRRCTIAFIGDSVTFGLSVSDVDTFANVLAKAYPRVHFVNAGVPAYNVFNVALTTEHIRADGYIYLLIDNDDEPEPNWREAKTRPQNLAMRDYLYVLSTPKNYYVPLPGFEAKLRELLALDFVTVVTFDVPGLGRDMAAKYPQIQRIPPYTQRVSRADSHPNAAGHVEIAKTLIPIVYELTARVCG